MHFAPQPFASSIVFGGCKQLVRSIPPPSGLEQRANYIVLDKSFKQCLISLKCLFERKSVFDHFDTV